MSDMEDAILVMYRAACEEAKTLLGAEEDEAEPYNNKYDAARKLEEVRADLDGKCAEGAAAARALLECRRGLALLDTDLLADGEHAVTSGLELLNELPGTLYIPLKVEAKNALGALWCNRDDYSKAGEHLRCAADLYASHGAEGQQQEAKDTSSSSGSGGNNGDGDEAAGVPDLLGGEEGEQRSRLEEQHTMTLFYLAQVYGHLGDRPKSAEYCGATLSRQLEAGSMDKDDWLQNCTQLGGFYLGEGYVLCARYMLNAAWALLERVKAEGAEVAEEVAANVSLGLGKFHMDLLAESAGAFRLQQQQGGAPGRDEEEQERALVVPDYLRFDSLGVSPGTEEDIALADSFAKGKDLFNEAMRRFSEAMGIYTSEGWFTEHFEILVDVSNIYRCLAVFEPDVHRKCVMHRQRVKGLEKIAEDMNQKLYMPLYRSAQIEMANAFREITDIKATEGREPAKVSAAAAKAIKCFEEFLGTLKDEMASGERIDGDLEPHILQAQVTLGSLYNKLQPGGGISVRAQMTPADADACKMAIMHSKNAASYVKKHSVEGMEQQAKLCEEMAALLEEKLSIRGGE